jgi:predicted class III extradiol MEMO1 family dioxygenase
VERALDLDAEGFFRDTTADLEQRRICGVGPIYTLLRLVTRLGADGAKMHHYAQHVDPAEGSIVSHTSIAFLTR